MSSSLRKRAEAWLAAAAVIVVLGGVIGRRALSGVAAPAPPPPQTADLDALSKYLAPLASPASTSSDMVEPPIGVQRDPFAAPVAEVVAAPARSDSAPVVVAPAAGTWTVNAVLITDSYRAAIINDALVTLGNKLSDGARLTAVERDHVVLMDAQGTKRIITVRDGNN
jgi:hypothetical protein